MAEQNLEERTAVRNDQNDLEPPEVSPKKAEPCFFGGIPHITKTPTMLR
jgi:hypothetical protein